MPDSESDAEHESMISRWIDKLLGLAQVIVVLSSVASVLTVFATAWWVADLCSNLRIQWMLALACGAILFAGIRRWKQAVFCVAMVGLHVPAFITGFGAAPIAPVGGDAETDSFSVATFNVLTSNDNYAAVEQQLIDSNADVIAVLELSAGLERHLGNRFAKAYPWSRTEVPQNGNFGIGLYSKHEWKSARIFILNDERIPSIEAELVINGRPVYAVATHTLPPMGEYGFRHRNSHLKQLVDRISRRTSTAGNVTPGKSDTVIVMGDLNLTPWSPHFEEFCSNSGLNRRGQGVWPTWYAYSAFPFGLVLDHVLTSNDLSCISHRISPAAGSDHRMVTVGLTFAE